MIKLKRVGYYVKKRVEVNVWYSLNDWVNSIVKDSVSISVWDFVYNSVDNVWSSVRHND